MRKQTAESFWAKVDKNGPVPAHAPHLGPCWLWKAGLDEDGYGKVRFNGKDARAHRVAYELAHGPIGDGLCACHNCDTRSCCNPGHLFPGSSAANTADKVAKGRQASGRELSERIRANAARGARNGKYTKPECTPRGDRHGSKTKPERVARGERSGMAVLTESRVAQIRAATGSISSIARAHNVGWTTVANIKKGLTWKQVGAPGDLP